MKSLLENALVIVFGVLFLLMQFPGGTVFMALSCPGQRLDGLDWVLSVIVPAYGLLNGARCLL